MQQLAAINAANAQSADSRAPECNSTEDVRCRYRIIGATSERKHSGMDTPLLATGISLSTLALAGGVLGASLMSSVEDGTTRAGALGALAGCGTLAAFGVPLTFAGALGDSKTRDSVPLMSAGIMTTSLGAGSVAAGAVMLAHPDSEAGAGFVGITSMISGGILAAAGIPMWVLGARQPTVRDPDLKDDDELHDANAGVWVTRNRVMRNVGIGLTAGSAAPLIAGIILVKTGQDSCGEFGCPQAYAGIASFGLSGAMVLTGIPLWAIGGSSQLVDPSDPRVKPQVTVGPGWVQVSGSF